MAHAITSVTSTLPRVGICAVTLPQDGPSIHVFQLDGGHLIAYDRNTWKPEQIHGWAQMRFGDYELVQPAPEAGA
jgi:uncharacterized protein (AIM24 family)